MILTRELVEGNQTKELQLNLTLFPLFVAFNT